MSQHGPVRPTVSPSDPSCVLPDDFLLTYPHASRRSGVSESTLRRAVANGTLVVHYVGKYQRIRVGDLVAYIASLRRPT